MVEKVSLKLAKLIYDYIKNKKNIDKSFIKEQLRFSFSYEEIAEKDQNLDF